VALDTVLQEREARPAHQTSARWHVSFFKKAQQGDDSKLTVTEQGGRLVVRDERGHVVKASAAYPATMPKKKSRRARLRDITEDESGSSILDQHMVHIAMGKPWRSELPDGQYTDWVVPTTSERLQALTFLTEQRDGKAVAQTELLKAMVEEDSAEQYRAYSDEQIAAAARPYLERIAKKEVIVDAEDPTSDGE